MPRPLASQETRRRLRREPPASGRIQILAASRETGAEAARANMPTRLGTVGSSNMANEFKNLSFDELVERADEGHRGNGHIVEANRRNAKSTNRLAITILIFTAVILLLNFLMVFPELKP